MYATDTHTHIIVCRIRRDYSRWLRAVIRENVIVCVPEFLLGHSEEYVLCPSASSDVSYRNNAAPLLK